MKRIIPILFAMLFIFTACSDKSQESSTSLVEESIGTTSVFETESDVSTDASTDISSSVKSVSDSVVQETSTAVKVSSSVLNVTTSNRITAALAIRTTSIRTTAVTTLPTTSMRSTSAITSSPVTSKPTQHISTSVTSSVTTTKPASVHTVAPQTTVTHTTESVTVTVCCDCKNAVDYGIREQPDYGGIPTDGILFNTSVTLDSGATALDALSAAATSSNIALSVQRGYIKSIGGLSEKDCGASSGWLYSVNDTFPFSASDKYVLKSGDTVRLVYSVKNGDVPNMQWG